MENKKVKKKQRRSERKKFDEKLNLIARAEFERSQ
jgi:hypothetical protein